MIFKVGDKVKRIDNFFPTGPYIVTRCFKNLGLNCYQIGPTDGVNGNKWYYSHESKLKLMFPKQRISKLPGWF
jgi:hypothetical protein